MGDFGLYETINEPFLYNLNFMHNYFVSN